MTIIYAAILASALSLSGCANGVAGKAEVAMGEKPRCQVAVDIAGADTADNYDPALTGGGDCKAEFAAANLPMLGLKKPGDPASTPGLEHITRFGPITRVDGSTVTVKMDFVCLRLCGHGEEITAVLKDGHWIVTSRRNTWIS